MFPAVIGQRPVAAGEFHPDVVFPFFPAADFQQADFTGALDMGAAAGTAVAVRDRHETDLLEFCAGRFAQRIRRQFGGFNEFRVDWSIAEDHGVGGHFDFIGQFGGQGRQRHVDLDGGGAEMEADIFRLNLGEKDTGQDVLAGVLLHVVEAPPPVDFADDRAVAGVAVDGVDDFAVFGLDVQYRQIVERSRVAGLPAAFRIKGGAVEDDGEPAVAQRRFA